MEQLRELQVCRQWHCWHADSAQLVKHTACSLACTPPPMPAPRLFLIACPAAVQASSQQPRVVLMQES